MAGALLGAAVGELVHRLMLEVVTFRHRNDNLRDLEERLKRLESSVTARDFVEIEQRPTVKWLSDIRQLLERADDLVSKCRNSKMKLMINSGEFKKINERLDVLMRDAIFIRSVEQKPTYFYQRYSLR